MSDQPQEPKLCPEVPTLTMTHPCPYCGQIIGLIVPAESQSKRRVVQCSHCGVEMDWHTGNKCPVRSKGREQMDNEHAEQLKASKSCLLCAHQSHADMWGDDPKHEYFDAYICVKRRYVFASISGTDKDNIEYEAADHSIIDVYCDDFERD